MADPNLELKGGWGVGGVGVGVGIDLLVLLAFLHSVIFSFYPK